MSANSLPVPQARPGPAIVEDGLYTREQLIEALQTSPNTIDRWIADGMKSARRATRRRYFLGRHVIEFLFEEKP